MRSAGPGVCIFMILRPIGCLVLTGLSYIIFQHTSDLLREEHQLQRATQGRTDVITTDISAK